VGTTGIESLDGISAMIVYNILLSSYDIPTRY